MTFLGMPLANVAAAFPAAVRARHDRRFLCVTAGTDGYYSIPASALTYGTTADAVAATTSVYRASDYDIVDCVRSLMRGNTTSVSFRAGRPLPGRGNPQWRASS